MNYNVDENGFYGEYGGAYVPEILYKTVEDLKKAYLPIIQSDEFKKTYHSLLADYVGRPSPLYFARRMSEKYGCQLYLKREDLNHTGAHKINNAIGQILIAKMMGKKRIIAETGAGQHGVATATVAALMNMPCVVYMGATDVERQRPNVERMKMLGATVSPVHSGNKTLKDATNEAIRDWCCHPADTFYIIGSTVGPHPYPDRYHLPLSGQFEGEDCACRSRWYGDKHRHDRRLVADRHTRHPTWFAHQTDADRRRTDCGTLLHLGWTRLSRHWPHSL